MFYVKAFLSLLSGLASCLALTILLCGQLYAANKASIETGRAIYQFGKTDDGTAMLEGAGGSAPAELFPCANCHGERAQGKKETGLVAPNITWPQLQRAYRRDLDGGRKRNPYDFESIKRLVTNGVSSDRDILSGVMPRYRLSDLEIESLILYLKQINEEVVEGVTDNVIRIGVRLPAEPEIASVVKHTLQVYVDKLKTTHGIYRRVLEFVDISNASIDHDVFCVLDISLRHNTKIGGDKVELAVFSAKQQSDLHYALYQHPLAYSAVAAAVLQRSGLMLVKADQMQERLAEAAIILHTPDGETLVELLSRLKAHGIDNGLLTLSPATSVMPEQYQNKIFRLQPPGPESVSETGQRAVFDYINQDQGRTELAQYLPQRLWTLSLLELLTATLQTVGKDLTQERFERVLQSHVDLNTGFGPKLSYSASRRVGNIGAVLKQSAKK